MWNKKERYLIRKLIRAHTRDLVIACRGGFKSFFYKSPDSLDRLPPAALRIRVGDPKRERYLGIGNKICNRLLFHVKKYRSIDNLQKVLDWGCGCGRVTRQMLNHVPATSLYGCDIDPQAINWMNKNFKKSSFTTIKPYPPTHYEDRFFDFIYGISVFTHLNEKLQFEWLNELRRITAKDGLVAVSVRGGGSRKRPELAMSLKQKGFVDMTGNKSFLFRHLEDKNYYRETKHSRDYIFREWSNYFKILEFAENGLGRQDLVIMSPE